MILFGVISKRKYQFFLQQIRAFLQSADNHIRMHCKAGIGDILEDVYLPGPELQKVIGDLLRLRGLDFKLGILKEAFLLFFKHFSIINIHPIYIFLFMPNRFNVHFF